MTHHPNMEVVKVLGKPQKTRKTYCYQGFSPEVNYAVYNNSLDAIIRGITERIFYVDYGAGFQQPPKPSHLTFSTALKEVHEFFRNRVPYANPLTARQFAESYQARRRTRYEQACDSLILNPISRKDANIDAFVKAEKYNFTAKQNPAPRIIQPRNPRYIVESGRYVKPIEKKIYKLIDELFGAPTIFKGLNADDRGRALHGHWLDFKRPVAIGLDAKRFDQHVSPAALRWEHDIYKLFYPRDKFFAKLLDWQTVNRGFARCVDGVVKYTVHGCRMSGDTNTALGNCLLMSSMVYSYLVSIGVRGKLANDGDDCVVIVESSDVKAFQSGLHDYFIKLGFYMEVEEPVYVFEEIEFCQSHPVWVDGAYRMVRDPRVAISKDCVALKPLDDLRIARRWLSAVGQGGMHLTGGIPVWQDFYQKFIDLSDGAKPLEDPTLMTGMRLLGKGMYHTYIPPSDRSRLSFYNAFKIAPAAQECLEEYYRSKPFDFNGDGPRFVTLPL